MIVCNRVLTKREVASILETIQSEKWVQGATNKDLSHKNNKELHSSIVAKFVSEKILAHEKVKFYGFLKHLLPVRFNLYENSGKYAKHIDFFRQEGIRTDLSMTLFLTEPDTYEGGELVINEQEVKLEAGDMILYNSGQIHGVNPVTKGQRIAAISWAQSYIEDAHNREIVGKVGETIHLMEQQDFKDEDIVNLSFVYNNLLRKWST